ncbi:MAG: hypothetical protein ACR652_09330 [Methylocystis sp.]|uniref:hypothetical protein n=1 Tax=Methylocystis sp. TaxID=1911079 RepID=UPI003DA25365
MAQPRQGLADYGFFLSSSKRRSARRLIKGRVSLLICKFDPETTVLCPPHPGQNALIGEECARVLQKSKKPIRVCHLHTGCSLPDLASETGPKPFYARKMHTMGVDLIAARTIMKGARNQILGDHILSPPAPSSDVSSISKLALQDSDFAS